MMQRKMSERKVLRKLGIPDFRHMTKDKIIAFSTMIPHMDPEVAKKALEQFPEYTKLAGEMVGTYKAIIDKMLDANAKDVQVFYDACNSILMSLQKQLDKEDITEEQRDSLNERMIRVADMIGEKVSENKRFWLSVLGEAGKWLLGIFGLVLTWFGFTQLRNNMGNDSDSDEDDDIDNVA